MNFDVAAKEQRTEELEDVFRCISSLVFERREGGRETHVSLGRERGN